jgi:hypothetical protein
VDEDDERPIYEVEFDFRRRGMFLLVDPDGRKLWFYGYSHDQTSLKRAMESMKGRRDEMIKLLLSRASVRGETT